MQKILKLMCYNTSVCAPGGVYETFRKHRNIEKEFLGRLANEIRGQTIKIATIYNPPLSYTETVKGKLVGRGVAFEVINVLQRKYKFKYKVVEPKIGIVGNNETGILGMLNKGEAEVGAAFIPVLRKFFSFAHYSPALDQGEWSVLMKRPIHSYTGEGYLSPFTTNVWHGLLLSLIFLGPIIWAIIKIQSKLPSKIPKTTANFYNCSWFVYSGIVKQGTSILPMTDSARLLLATWWLVVIIVSAFYSANLTALVTATRYTLPIITAEDVGWYGNSWIAGVGTGFEEAVTNPLESLHHDLRGSSGVFVNESQLRIMNELVGQRSFLYIGESPIPRLMLYTDYLNKTKYRVPEAQRCPYVVTKSPIFYRERAFAYSKNFYFKPLFDHGLQYILESGIVSYNVKYPFLNTEVCPYNLRNVERQLKTRDLDLPYQVIGIGLTLGWVSFVIELILGHTFLKKKTPKSEEESHEFGQRPPSYYTLFGVSHDDGTTKEKVY